MHHKHLEQFLLIVSAALIIAVLPARAEQTKASVTATATSSCVVVGSSVKAEAAAEVKPATKPTHRTWLGIGMAPLSDDDRGQLPIPAGTGLMINHVEDDGPAAKADMKENDILTKFNDQILMHPMQLRHLVRHSKDTDSATFTVFRDGKEIKIKALLGKQEITDDNADENPTEEEEVAEPPQRDNPAWLGVAPGALEDEERTQAKLGDAAGIILRQVMEDGPSAKAGLKEGDIVLKFNEQLLILPTQLPPLVWMSKPGDVATLTILRDGKETKIKVTLGKKAD